MVAVRVRCEKRATSQLLPGKTFVQSEPDLTSAVAARKVK